nr:1284_t:CDS:2 [Entrophospora candida]
MSKNSLKSTRYSLKSTTILFCLLLWFGIINKSFINSTPLPQNSNNDNNNKEVIRAGYVAYADFMNGRTTFTQITPELVRVTGQVNTGMTDPDPKNYKIRIVYRPSCPAFIRHLDLTPKLIYSINVPGSSAYEADFDAFTVLEIIGMYIQVVHTSQGVIGYGQIIGI